ncbi:MAG: hypothetical protein ABSH06_05355 [Thermodesulfobacteriota bacterium]
MSNAIGLAVHFTPLPRSKWKIASRIPMTKYICAGLASLAEVIAVLLAQMGYTTDTTASMVTLDFRDVWEVISGILKHLPKTWVAHGEC